MLDTSWAGGVAPNATVKLVISKSTNATDGVDLSEQYIIENNLADVMTESYGDCEANYTQAEGQFIHRWRNRPPPKASLTLLPLEIREPKAATIQVPRRSRLDRYR